MNKPKDKTAPERVARYTKNQQAKGLVQVRVWVKKENAEKVRQFALKLR